MLHHPTRGGMEESSRRSATSCSRCPVGRVLESRDLFKDTAQPYALDALERRPMFVATWEPNYLHEHLMNASDGDTIRL